VTAAELEALHDPDPRRRAVAATLLGHRGTRGCALALRAAARSDASPEVRAAALAAVVRVSRPTAAAAAVRAALRDHDAAVRRRACELAPAVLDDGPSAPLIERLADDEALVAEAAAFALGELRASGEREALALAAVATAHDDALVREAAIAALGAIGHEAGREAILAGCRDKPTVRRRAVLALAPFRGPDVDAALDRAAEDRDWQVRDAADVLRRVDEEDGETPTGARDARGRGRAADRSS
jgi:HEAT repeat protein